MFLWPPEEVSAGAMTGSLAEGGPLPVVSAGQRTESHEAGGLASEAAGPGTWLSVTFGLGS